MSKDQFRDLNFETQEETKSKPKTEISDLPSIPVHKIPAHLARVSLKVEEAEWLEINSSGRDDQYMQFKTPSQAKSKRTRMYHARKYLLTIYENTNPELHKSLSLWSISTGTEPTPHLHFIRIPETKILDSLEETENETPE